MEFADEQPFRFLSNPGTLRRVNVGVIVLVVERDDRLALGGGQAQAASPLA
jgi:hypothetical protein